ncbi:zinc finger, CCHC-type containing protein [Tanacetum coccineum]|uniref:Zinc finger, CCHC-type containing protein n=1 Tax=Tanacetum coccineum TaxID=301880 RepID=A0ABQ5GTN6_9ASTR
MNSTMTEKRGSRGRAPCWGLAASYAISCAAFLKEAIDDEIGSIMKNNTWVLSDLPPRCKPLGCKWIFKRKMKVDGTIDKFKARLVIQGFRQKEEIDYFDTYAPVARITTIRLLLALDVIHNLVIHQMDLKITFLNGDLDEEVYMKQPEGFVMSGNEHKVCKLVKSLYGLKQAPNSGKCVIIYLYVDDMLIFGTDQNQVDKTKKFLTSKFSIKIYENKGIVITQTHCIKKILKKFNREDCSPVSTPIDPVEKLKPNTGKPVDQLEYSRAIGCLMYAMTSTRSDIAYAVCRLSRFTSNPTKQHWKAITRVFKYLRDSSSTSGWVFLHGGGAILWASKKQTCITGSNMESEFIALVAAGKEAEWLRNLIHEIPIWPKPIAPISIRYDSAPTMAKAYSQIYNGKSRRLVKAAPIDPPTENCENSYTPSKKGQSSEGTWNFLNFFAFLGSAYIAGETHSMIADPKNATKFKKFHVPLDDCPFFEGVYEFLQLSPSGSIGVALALNEGTELSRESRNTGGFVVSIDSRLSESRTIERGMGNTMKIALHARNKMIFVDGSCVKAAYASSVPLTNQWERCNAVVLSWLLSSISDDLYLTYKKLFELSDVRDACVIVCREESHRGLGSSLGVQKPQISSFVSRTFENQNKNNNGFCNQNTSGFNNQNNKGQYNSVSCKNYGMKGHTIDRCFEIIGYPNGFKMKQNVKKISNNMGNSSNNVDVHKNSSDIPFINEQIAKLMSLIGDKPGNGIHTNMAGANQHITSSTKNMTDVVDITDLNITAGHPNRTDLKRENVLGTSNEAGGLYVFNTESKLLDFKSNNCFLSCNVSKGIWHNRLGHPSDQVLSVLKYRLSIGKPTHVMPCETCHHAKQVREPFPLSEHKFVSLGDLIHLDL